MFVLLALVGLLQLLTTFNSSHAIISAFFDRTKNYKISTPRSPALQSNPPRRGQEQPGSAKSSKQKSIELTIRMPTDDASGRLTLFWMGF